MIAPLALRGLTLLLAVIAALALPAGAWAADPPNPRTAAAGPPAPPAKAAPPAPVSLSRGWQYAPDPGDAGEGLGWPEGRAGPTWQPVAVPHVFNGRADEAGFYGTVGWYRISFAGPITPAGMSWALRFEQVRRVTRAWLNGRPIGSNREPYTPFELPAAGLRPGQANTLVVRVDNRRARALREGWWNWGGITRPVSLVPRGPLVLRDPGLLPRRRCGDGGCRWSVLVDGWLENASGSDQRPSIAIALRSPDGTLSRGTARRRTLHPGERVRVRFDVAVRGDAQTWSPAEPRLYQATVTTRAGDRIAQRDRDRVGLRTVEVTDGTLRLNGRPLALRGASIQEDAPGRGPALSDRDIDNTVAELKALGVDVTRAHYPLNERLLDRFDEEGILVWNQAPIYHRDRQMQTARQRAHELDVLRRTILATRSHPSVITHSTTNEPTPVPDERPPIRTWLLDAARLTRDLDPSRPVSLDVLSYPGIAKQRTYDAYDMIGINSYYGWYHEAYADYDVDGTSRRSTGDLGALAPYLRAMNEKYPRQALVITEFGAEATEPGPASVRQTYAFQTQYVKRSLEIVDRLGFVNGAIYWTAREFAVKPDWDGGAHPAVRDGIHNKGLIAYDGKVKPAFAAARSAFEATPPYRDPRAIARAELSHPPPIVLSGLLVIFVVGLVGAMLTLDALWLRDIWRALRPPAAEVVELRRRAA